VGNLTEVGRALRSQPEVRPDRDPEVPGDGGQLLFREWLFSGAGSARGEGESPTVELASLGGGEGQESNGLFGCLTVPVEERLLNRSKALESGS
jgi:hypothetical protein